MIIEPYAPCDRTFVLGGLVKGLAQLDVAAGVDAATSARWAYGAAVRYLGRGTAKVYVLSIPPFQAPRGFLAAETLQGVLASHYLWVEPSWRRTGAANALLDAAHGAGVPVIATNMTVEGRELLSSRRYEYVPQVWRSLQELDDWKLAGSTRHHTKQFLAAAEWLASERP